VKKAAPKLDCIDDNGKGRGDPVKYRVAVNSEIRYKANLQTDRAAARSLTYNYTLLDLTLDDLAELLRERCNIAHECRNSEGRYHRKKEYFICADWVGLDFDNSGAEYLSLEVALAHPFIKLHAGIVYTTASHKPEFHKFRVIFPLPERIIDRELFELINRALIWLFKTDESCKDASRFYFGTGENGQVIVIGNCLTSEAIDNLLKECEATRAPKQEWKAQRDADSSATIPTSHNTVQDRRQMYAQQGIDTAAKIIYESYPPSGDSKGNRHNARTRAAYLLGGYVGGGLLSYNEARAALESAVLSNTNNFSSAMRTIDDCLSEGQSEPITYEDKERERQEYLRRHGDSQKQGKKEALRQLVRESAAKEDEYTATRRRATSADFAALSIITAELGFSDKSRVGLQSLIALSGGRSCIEWSYGDLYPYLRRYDAELFRQAEKPRRDTPMPQNKECSHANCKTNRCEKPMKQAQSKINGIVRGYLDAIDKDQDRCGIKLADTRRGSKHIDEKGNEVYERSETSLPILSCLEEIDSLSKADPSYRRASKRIRAEEARLLAGRLTKYEPQKKETLTPRQEILMAMKRAAGNLKAAIELMRAKEYEDWAIKQDLRKHLPAEFFKIMFDGDFHEGDSPHESHVSDFQRDSMGQSVDDLHFPPDSTPENLHSEASDSSMHSIPKKTAMNKVSNSENAPDSDSYASEMERMMEMGW
jgi:hypothetical protein